MKKENQDSKSSIETQESLPTKYDTGKIFAAVIDGDKDKDNFKLKVYNGSDSEKNKSTFEGFIEKKVCAGNDQGQEIRVQLVDVIENGSGEKNYKFVPYVISYHTFMFPFLYATNKMTRKEFVSRCHPGWRIDLWNPEVTNDQIYYNQYHYFNETAHNAIYTTVSSKHSKKSNAYENENMAVINLRFDLSSLITEKQSENSEKKNVDSFKYVIRKYNDREAGEKLTVKFEYALDIKAIRMKLYNTGVGILIFELENRDWTSAEEQDIIQINDFGRRIYAPFYAYYKNDMHCSICANEIFFKVNGKHDEDINLLPDKLRSSAEETVLAEPIRTLLSNGVYSVTTKNTNGEYDTRIETAIDDRMFVACYYKNGDFVDTMREWDGENYRYITDAKSMSPFVKEAYLDGTAKDEHQENEDNGEKKTLVKYNPNSANRLYTMMYVDGDGICCHSRDMMQKMLSDDHIYTRWLEYGWQDKDKDAFAGTITGFSEYTMISVAKNPLPHLIDTFLTQYVEMAILALVQRASLLSFEYMISEYAHGRNYDVEDIHNKYILFQSQLLLNEITSQQQGIEIYDLLKQNLMIEKEHGEIKEQIERIFEHRNYLHDKKENGILFWLSLLSIAEAADIITDIIFLDSELSWKFIFSEFDASVPSFVRFGIMLAFALFIGVFYKRRK